LASPEVTSRLIFAVNRREAVLGQGSGADVAAERLGRGNSDCDAGDDQRGDGAQDEDCDGAPLALSVHSFVSSRSTKPCAAALLSGPPI